MSTRLSVTYLNDNNFKYFLGHTFSVEDLKYKQTEPIYESKLAYNPLMNRNQA